MIRAHGTPINWQGARDSYQARAAVALQDEACESTQGEQPDEVANVAPVHPATHFDVEVERNEVPELGCRGTHQFGRLRIKEERLDDGSVSIDD